MGHHRRNRQLHDAAREGNREGRFVHRSDAAGLLQRHLDRSGRLRRDGAVRVGHVKRHSAARPSLAGASHAHREGQRGRQRRLVSRDRERRLVLRSTKRNGLDRTPIARFRLSGEARSTFRDRVRALESGGETDPPPRETNLRGAGAGLRCWLRPRCLAAGGGVAGARAVRACIREIVPHRLGTRGDWRQKGLPESGTEVPAQVRHPVPPFWLSLPRERPPHPQAGSPSATRDPPRLKVLREARSTLPGTSSSHRRTGRGSKGRRSSTIKAGRFGSIQLERQQATDFRVQRYHGEPVLTWWQGSGFGGVASGVDYIADGSYRVIATVHAGNGLDADGHEFALTPQGTALITIYHEVPYDLSSVGGPKDGGRRRVVQEIDVETGRVLFEWHSLDHVPLGESYAGGLALRLLPHQRGQPRQRRQPAHLGPTHLDGLQGRPPHRTDPLASRRQEERLSARAGRGVCLAAQPAACRGEHDPPLRQREQRIDPGVVTFPGDLDSPRCRHQDRGARQGDPTSPRPLRRVTGERPGARQRATPSSAGVRSGASPSSTRRASFSSTPTSPAATTPTAPTGPPGPANRTPGRPRLRGRTLTGPRPSTPSGTAQPSRSLAHPRRIGARPRSLRSARLAGTASTRPSRSPACPGGGGRRSRRARQRHRDVEAGSCRLTAAGRLQLTLRVEVPPTSLNPNSVRAVVYGHVVALGRR